MNIIITHKFLLFAVVVSLAISVPLTEATKKQFIRGTVEKKNEREPRTLKSSKKGKNYGQPATTTTDSTTTTTNTTAETQSFVATPPGTTVTGWESKCSETSGSLDVCVGGDDTRKSTCKSCLLGQATLRTPNTWNVLSCTKIPQPISWCGVNCKDEVLAFFNCGAGTALTNAPATNMLVPTSGNVTTGSLSNTVVTSSSSSSSSGMTSSMSASVSAPESVSESLSVSVSTP